jgi:hypothetical protein
LHRVKISIDFGGVCPDTEVMATTHTPTPEAEMAKATREIGPYEADCIAFANMSRYEQEAHEAAESFQSSEDYRWEMGAEARAEMAMEAENDAAYVEYIEEGFWSFPNELVGVAS